MNRVLGLWVVLIVFLQGCVGTGHQNQDLVSRPYGPPDGPKQPKGPSSIVEPDASSSKAEHASISSNSFGGLFGAIAGFIGMRDDMAASSSAVVHGGLLGGLVGVQIGQHLAGQEKHRMANATALTVATGVAHSWKNPNNDAHGQARVVATKTKLERITIRVLNKTVGNVPPLVLIGGSYKARLRANVRSGPGTSYEIVDRLDNGQTVDVIGKVQSGNWFLIGRGGTGIGFVFASLMEPAPAEELNFSGAEIPAKDIVERQVSAEKTCRMVEQSVSLADGSSFSERMIACNGPDGWKVLGSGGGLDWDEPIGQE